MIKGDNVYKKANQFLTLLSQLKSYVVMINIRFRHLWQNMHTECFFPLAKWGY